MDGTGLDSSQNTSTSFIRVVSLSIALYESGPSLAYHPSTRAHLVLPQLHPHPSRRMEVLQKPALLAPQPGLPALHRHPVRPSPLSRAHSSLIGAHPLAHRYSSIAVIILSNVGYFGNFFTPASCARYFIIPPVFKGALPATSRRRMRPCATRVPPSFPGLPVY